MYTQSHTCKIVFSLVFSSVLFSFSSFVLLLEENPIHINEWIRVMGGGCERMSAISRSTLTHTPTYMYTHRVAYVFWVGRGHDFALRVAEQCVESHMRALRHLWMSLRAPIDQSEKDHVTNLTIVRNETAASDLGSFYQGRQKHASPPPSGQKKGRKKASNHSRFFRKAGAWLSKVVDNVCPERKKDIGFFGRVTVKNSDLSTVCHLLIFEGNRDLWCWRRLDSSECIEVTWLIHVWVRQRRHGLEATVCYLCCILLHATLCYMCCFLLHATVCSMCCILLDATMSRANTSCLDIHETWLYRDITQTWLIHVCVQFNAAMPVSRQTCVVILFAPLSFLFFFTIVITLVVRHNSLCAID